MCDCSAEELEAEPNVNANFGVIEQSPAGVTWTYNIQLGFFNGGQLGTLDELGAFDPMVEIEFADSGPDRVSEMVVIDEIYVWLLGQSGIYRIPVEDLSIPGLGIKDGVGIVDFTPVEDYRFYPSGTVEDFDISQGYVWWVEDQIVYRMAVDDFDGTPETMFDLTSDFGVNTNEGLVATSDELIWFAYKEQDPTFRAYNYDFSLAQTVEVESEGATETLDMTCERDTGILVVAGVVGGD